MHTRDDESEAGQVEMESVVLEAIRVTAKSQQADEGVNSLISGI